MSGGVRGPVRMGLVRALEFLVPTLLLMLGNQVMYQKFFSARTERDARISVVGWMLGTVLLETLIVAIAVFGSALYKTGEVAAQPYEIIPYTARNGLPAVMGALLLGAVFAKVISTASNYLFSPATNLIEDVFVRYIAPGASNKRVLHRFRGSPWCCWAAGRFTRPSTPPAFWQRCSMPTPFIGRADAGGAGGVLLKARHGVGRGGRDCDRDGGDAGLGRAWQ